MPEQLSARIRVGIGGWTYAPWRGAFYPEGLAQRRELEYASNKLSSIEVNGTYHGTQKPESFAKWHDETPDDFIFSLKAPRFATNRRVLAEARESVERFFDSGVMLLKNKLGVINWQFMPTKKFEPEDFEHFLGLLPKTIDGRTIRHAVEVRHESFKSPDFVALARLHEVAIVVAGDSPHPQIAEITAPFVYARIMGTREETDGGYTAAELDVWAKNCLVWASGGIPGELTRVTEQVPVHERRDVFLYVIGGYKRHNPAAAMEIISRLKNPI